MTLTRPRSFALFCCLSLALSACSGGSSGAAISERNADFFLGKVSDETLSGTYNPAGFSAAQVQSLAGQTCASGPLGSFGTRPREDGLVGFSATCATWKDGARLVEYERSTGSNVVIEITGSASGKLTYTRIDTQV